MPGLTTFEDIILERGKSDRVDFEEWQKLVYNAEDGKGEPDPAFRKNLIIELRNYNDQIVKKWEVRHAWISALKHSPFDAQSSDVVIQTATIVHEKAYPIQ